MAKYGVFGLGKSGRATVSYLLGEGHEVFAWDDNESSREGVGCVPYEDWPWEELSTLVLSPGVPFKYPQPHAVALLAEQYHVRTVCDVQLLLDARKDAVFIGITGTNGKSTTTALTGHIAKQLGLKAEIGGNIGTPALSLINSDAEIFILELSSYQLDLIDSARFKAAVLLNISPDHIDRHGSMEGYIEAKRRIFAGQEGGDVAIIGVDDNDTAMLAKEMVGSVSISSQNESNISIIDNILKVDSKAYTLPVIESLMGRHNAQNMAAAVAVMRVLGASVEDVVAAMTRYPGLPHRLERVVKNERYIAINDSKATNAISTEQAFAAIKEPIYWIAGGVAKEGGIAPLADYFAQVKKAYLIGEAAHAFAQTLGESVPHEIYDTMAQAVKSAHDEAEQGSVILLSPACASFDQYPNFEARGDHFKRLITELNDV